MRLILATTMMLAATPACGSGVGGGSAGEGGARQEASLSQGYAAGTGGSDHDHADHEAGDLVDVDVGGLPSAVLERPPTRLERPPTGALPGGLRLNVTGAPPPEEEGCDVVAPTSCPEPAPHYADVEPIFEARCIGCHGGVSGLWPLTAYSHAADWHDTIRSAMLACAMPPVDSGIHMPLSERQTLLTWIRCGYPQ